MCKISNSEITKIPNWIKKNWSKYVLNRTQDKKVIVLSFVDDNQICVVFFINFFFALKNAFDLEIRHDYDKEA